MPKRYNNEESNLDALLQEPEANYSYADYLKWTFEERVELIKGKIFKMSPAPQRRHQKVDVILVAKIYSYLEGKRCEVYTAPFDVRLPKNPKDPDDKIKTVVQPDICVICDADKLDEAGCKGAPDLIIEILSPATAKKDLKDKFHLYEENGVKEYWTVYPGEGIIEIFELKDNRYLSTGKYMGGDTIRSKILPNIALNLEEVFRD